MSNIKLSTTKTIQDVLAFRLCFPISIILFLLFVMLVSSGWVIQKPAIVTYTGPGDTVAFTAWYGLRAYTAAKAAAGTTVAVNIDRTSDSQACDVLIGSDGNLGVTANCSGAANGTTAETFCTATTCRVQKWYDQVAGNACGGASCNLIAAGTGGNRPQLLFGTANCGFSINSRACFVATSSLQSTASANNFTPSAALQSLSGVNRRTLGTTIVLNFFGNTGNGNLVRANASSGQWALVGGVSGTINVTASENTWHTANAVLNGASSVIALDGVDTTGTATASTTAAKPGTGGTSSHTGQWAEWGFINNVALTSGQRSSINTQQKSFWGF